MLVSSVLIGGTASACYRTPSKGPRALLETGNVTGISLYEAVEYGSMPKPYLTWLCAVLNKDTRNPWREKAEDIPGEYHYTRCQLGLSKRRIRSVSGGFSIRLYRQIPVEMGKMC